MLTIRKTSDDKWELLLRVLSEEIPESNPVFQSWLQEDKENMELYQSIKGGKPADEVIPDKDKIFDNIAEILSFNQKAVPFFRKRRFIHVAAVILLIFSGFASYLIISREMQPARISENQAGEIRFDPGSKKAYLLSSSGETIDLSESFEIVKEDGTVISNDPQGTVSINEKEAETLNVENHTLYVPKGGAYALVLADGSKVYLNSETKLIFPARFSDSIRKVELIGEAYFEIVENEKPFVVHTAYMQVEVFGTSFVVNAYQDNTYTSATLVEGHVQIQTPDTSSPILLKQGENINMDNISNEISIKEVDPSIYTAWVRGEFIFRNYPLNDILTQLSRWYDFTVTYEDPAIRTMMFTGSAEKSRSLDYLFDMITSVTDIKYRKENGNIVLYK